MPVWEYTAKNATSGQITKGQLDVPTRDDVIAFLRRGRMTPVTVREATKSFNISFGGGVQTRDVVIFTRQFATMINAGLPLVQSLSILAQQSENKILKEVTKTVVYDVEAGNTLADALRKHPKVFTDLYVNMVAAGEAGGILDTILLRLATFLEKNDALVRKVKGAMVYPAVIMSVAAIAIAVLLIFVIPTFQSMFASVNMELPFPTRFVIGASDILIRLVVADHPDGCRGWLWPPAVLRHRQWPEDASTPCCSTPRCWATCSGSRRCHGSPGPWEP